MPKRLLKSVLIGLKRDDKDWSPKPDQVHDFTQEEIEMIEESNPSALALPPDESKDKTMRSTRKVADVPVGTDPVNSRATGGDGGAEVVQNPELLAGQNQDAKPAVDANLKVKGAPTTDNPKPGPQNIAKGNNTGKTGNDDDL